MRTVWKYQAELNDTIEFTLPKEAQLLKVGIQQGAITFWFLVDPDNPLADCKPFSIRDTGHPVPDNVTYIDSVFDGPFVWHIFKPKSTEHIVLQDGMYKIEGQQLK